MEKQQTTTPEFDLTAPSEFQVGDKVFAIDKNKYDIYQAVVKKVVGPNLYDVVYPDYETEETVEQERILVRNEKNTKIYEEQERVRNDIEDHNPENEEEQGPEGESAESSDDEPQEQPELIDQGDSDHQGSDQANDYIPEKRKYTKRKGPKKSAKKTGKVGRPRIHPIDELSPQPKKRLGRKPKSLKKLEEEQLAQAIAESQATANAAAQNSQNEAAADHNQNAVVPAASGNITFSKRPQNMEITSSQQSDGAVTISFKIYFN